LYLSIPLQNRTGSEIFDRLFRHESIATLLESPATSSSLTRYSICAGSPQVIDNQPQMFTPGIGEILDCLRGLLASNRDNRSDLPAHLPFTGGWLGWLGYELAWEIEELPKLQADPLPFPIAYWYAPQAFAVLDHQEQVLYLSAPTTAELDDLVARLDRVNSSAANVELATSSVDPIAPGLFKPEISSKLISHSDLAPKLSSIAGRSINDYKQLILRPLPAIGKHLGAR
jgi:para-aminobenzoate synthetase component I